MRRSRIGAPGPADAPGGCQNNLRLCQCNICFFLHWLHCGNSGLLWTIPSVVSCPSGSYMSPPLATFSSPVIDRCALELVEMLYRNNHIWWLWEKRLQGQYSMSRPIVQSNPIQPIANLASRTAKLMWSDHEDGLREETPVNEIIFLLISVKRALSCNGALKHRPLSFITFNMCGLLA
jgi:hypothetical protein